MAGFWSKVFGASANKGVARYQIMGPIASGGMSVVYRAKDRETGDMVALKIIKQGAMEVSDRIQRAYHKSEGEIAASLRHESVVRTFDHGFEGKRYYLAMEYVDGSDLKSLINMRDPMVTNNRMGLIMKMGSGLAYIHDQNLLHRDFCPKNVLLTSSGEPKIIDFGLCIPRRRKKRWKWDRSGTPSYMAPEQVRGQPVDERADIYAFGLTMYEVLAGKRAFKESPTREGKMQPHLNVLPPPPSQFDTTVTPALDAICIKAVAKQREQRHVSMNELLAELRDAAGELQGQPGW